MSDRTLRGKVAVAGIGETEYTKHGRAAHPEFKLALLAILAACEDAGLDPASIDGFSSYSNDRCDPSRLAAALGARELRFASMLWGGGGGGVCGAVVNAASAVATGVANCVVVFRALAQGQYTRYGRGSTQPTIDGAFAFEAPYGVLVPGQRFAMKVMRFMHQHRIDRSALRAIAMNSYRHAQTNPRAVMRGRPLDAVTYDTARWIVEPFRLFDCCMENDGAAALILVAADRARELRQRPVYLLGGAEGSGYRAGASSHNAPDYASSHFKTVARNLYAMSRLTPKDVDVVQCYENFTGGVLMSLVEHGFFAPEEANDFLTVDNLAALGGRLPLNTSGGNLAECYMHGFELLNEAVRQVRGTAVNQVENKVDVSLVIGGPMVTPVGSVAFGSETTVR